MRFILLLSLAVFASAPAAAQSEIKLSGMAFLDEDNCKDGTKGADCVLSFSLEGKAAKILYNGMPGKGRKEECTGGFEKSDGNGLHCIMGADKSYSCDFGYSFAKKSFGPGGMDC